MTVLPRLKESAHSKIKNGPSLVKEEYTENMLNIKELQKRLHKMRNSRIGKKILVINSYGV